MNWLKSFWKRLTTVPTEQPRVHVLPLSQSIPGAPQGRRSGEPVRDFTPRAQQVLGLARKEADRLHNNFIGTEHLLLGIIALGQGTAVAVLGRMGINLETVRAEVKKCAEPASDQEKSGNIPYTPRVKKVLALAVKEARRLNHTYVGTEHILLGLLEEGDGLAGRILKNLGMDLVQTRQEILKELDPNFPPSADASKSSPSTTSPASTQRVVPSLSSGEPVDLGKRYDVHCTDWSQGVTVYSNVRFKGVKHLFPKSQYDAQSGFVELEPGDGQTFFVSRSSIIKFCEHTATPGAGESPKTSG